MLVRVVRQPVGYVEGASLRQLTPGRTYDFDPSIADYLVVQGYAVIEMRRGQRSQRVRLNDRRSFSRIIDEYRDGKKIKSD